MRLFAYIRYRHVFTTRTRTWKIWLNCSKTRHHVVFVHIWTVLDSERAIMCVNIVRTENPGPIVVYGSNGFRCRCCFVNIRCIYVDFGSFLSLKIKNLPILCCSRTTVENRCNWVFVVHETYRFLVFLRNWMAINRRDPKHLPNTYTRTFETQRDFKIFCCSISHSEKCNVVKLLIPIRLFGHFKKPTKNV